MLLHTDPEPGHGSPQSRPVDGQPSLSLRERLFGDRSLIWTVLLALAAVFGVYLFVRDGDALHDLTRALIFTALLFGSSRERTVQAGVVGLTVAMIWVVADVGLAVVALCGLLTALVEYASAEVTRDLEESASRQPRAELQARIHASAALQIAATIGYATPIALAAYRLLTDGGVAVMYTPLVILVCAVFLAISTYRRLRDFSASFVGRSVPPGSVGR